MSMRGRGVRAGRDRAHVIDLDVETTTAEGRPIHTANNTRQDQLEQNACGRHHAGRSAQVPQRVGGAPLRIARRLARAAIRDSFAIASMAKDAERGLTAGAFASLLTRLGPDAERAGSAYEHLRRALVSFFAWRGAATPEECADETLDRLAKRLDEGVAVENVATFARGIARLVLLEHWRRPDARVVPLEEESSRHLTAEPLSDDALAECLHRCLGELAPDSRGLIVGYYGAEGRSRIDTRKRMAQALGISESALRNRAQRLRDSLESCITRSLAAVGPRSARPSDTKP